MKLYVGNLPYSCLEDELRTLFAEHGDVVNVTIVNDRATGQSRGFGFVEMGSREQGEAAIEKLDGHKQGGRALVVKEAKPKEARPQDGNRRPPRGGGDREQRSFRPQRYPKATS